MHRLDLFYLRWKLIGTLDLDSTAIPFCLAGTNCHPYTALTAALSNALSPDEASTHALVTVPSIPIINPTLVVPSRFAALDDSGYCGLGLLNIWGPIVSPVPTPVPSPPPLPEPVPGPVPDPVPDPFPPPVPVPAP